MITPGNEPELNNANEENTNNKETPNSSENKVALTRELAIEGITKWSDEQEKIISGIENVEMQIIAQVKYFHVKGKMCMESGLDEFALDYYNSALQICYFQDRNALYNEIVKDGEQYFGVGFDKTLDFES